MTLGVAINPIARATLALIVAGSACAGSSLATGQPDYTLTAAPVGYVSISDSLPADSEVTALVSPYRDQLAAEMSRVIGYARGEFTKAQPEGTLGNLVADAMLHHAQSLTNDPVDIAVTNNGGLRVPLYDGPVTVGEIFELAPFENFLTVIELTGSDVRALAHDIAGIGGEPVAGLTFHIDSATGAAADLRVGGAPVRDDRTYRLVTLDYLLDGGGFMRTLWTPRPRVTSDMLLRDAIIQYIELHDEIRPKREDRITRARSESQ